MPAALRKATLPAGPLGQRVLVSADAERQLAALRGKVTRIFDGPSDGDVVRLHERARVYHRDHGWMTLAQARAVIEGWKEHAARQGKTRANSSRVVLSLFDRTGSWSQPWEDAGYAVYRFDLQTCPEMGDVTNFSVEFFNDYFGNFDGNDVYAVLAACPCTHFSGSGARHFAAKDADGRTEESIQLVEITKQVVEYFRPQVWAIENPVGRIETLCNLKPWTVAFDPNHFGDPYTKRTQLWGRMNGELPIAPVEPTEGTKMHRLYGGSSQRTKNLRSITPEGFAYSFFMANNAVDNPLIASGWKFDMLDQRAVAAAITSGMDEAAIAEVVEDLYYMDMDYEGASAALWEACGVAMPKGVPPLRPEPVQQQFALF